MAMEQDSNSRASKRLQVSASPAASTPPEEEVLDGEVLDDETSSAAGSRTEDIGGDDPGFRARRKRRREHTRSFFGGREKRSRVKPDSIPLDVDYEALNERERITRLRGDIQDANEAFMTSLRDSKLLVPGFSEKEREKEFDIKHHIYMQMMMQGLMRPLSSGINTRSIIQAAGMFMTMRLLSKDFRAETDQYRDALKDAIQNRIDRKAQQKGSLAEQRLEQTRARGQQGSGDDLADRNALMSRKWAKRLEDVERRQRGNRELFTPESAALTEVGLMENAFWRMRDNTQDSAEILESYGAMRTLLRQQMADDGLDRDEVVKRARMIIGQRLEAEPELKLVFTGMAFGRIVKSAPHEERVAGTDRVRTVWTGEFEDQLGDPVPADGMFTMRAPMSPEEHQAQLAESMTLPMLESLKRHDEKGYGESVTGYLVGFAARQSGMDPATLSSPLRQRVEQSELMLASMAVDGLDEEKRREVYSNAFTDAMETVASTHPGIGAVLRRQFGEDWQTTLQEGVNDPKRFFESHTVSQTTFEVGDDGTQRAGTEWNRSWGFAVRDTETDDYQPA